MTLFWHNHFATGVHQDRRHAWVRPKATRYMAAKASEDPAAGARPDRDAARQRARQLPRSADRRSRKTRRCSSGSTAATNTRARPQENFGARDHGAVHDGRRPLTPRPTCMPPRASSPAGTCRGRRAADGRSTTSSSTTPSQHDTAAKTFSFPIYPDGSTTIPARSAADGMQDGIDFIDGARGESRTRPATSRRSCIGSSSPSSATSANRSSTGSPTSTCRAGTT